MKRAIVIQVIRIPIDRLLKIADHAEVAWARGIEFGLKPFAPRFNWSRDFEQDKKLLRSCILSLVKEHPIIPATDLLRDVAKAQQFSCELYLIRVRNRAMRQTEFPIVLLNFSCYARRARACPFPHRPKRFAPLGGEM